MKRGGLQAEIKQTRPFRSSGQEAAVALLRTADVLRRRFAALLAPTEITVQQYNVLRILRGAGAAGLPTLEIAERMIERAPGITRLIDKLEAAGLVARERSAEDRRAVVCRATAKGLALLAGLDDAVDAADDEALGMLTERERRDLIRVLEKVREATP
jgi:DNA-binding MarR family transcriptional regulator